jgi:hypothetical protein
MMRQFAVVNDRVRCNNNSVCDPCEDCVSCPSDCLSVAGSRCGNGVCEVGDGEDCRSCAVDCAAPAGLCCGVTANCSDAGCSPCQSRRVMRACCGDGLCEGHESATTCSRDCSARTANQMQVCGDCVCDYFAGQLWICALWLLLSHASVAEQESRACSAPRTAACGWASLGCRYRSPCSCCSPVLLSEAEARYCMRFGYASEHAFIIQR